MKTQSATENDACRQLLRFWWCRWWVILVWFLGGANVLQAQPSGLPWSPEETFSQASQIVFPRYSPRDVTALKIAAANEEVLKIEVQINALGRVTKTLILAGAEPLGKQAAKAATQWQFPVLPDNATRTGQVLFRLLLHEESVWLAIPEHGNRLVIPAVPLEKQGPMKKPRDRFLFTPADFKPKDEASAQTTTPAKAEGGVQVQVLISEEGNVLAARAILGPPLLHAASVKAALQWKFKPTLLSGQPVKVEGILTFNYRL